jgi:glutamate dehydrogenase (NAD(P)+)
MAWMMDTYSVNVGHTASGVVTGKPIALGGSLGRQEATGRGVFIAAREAGLRMNVPIAGARVVVQGFGNVGGVAARIFRENGAKVIALQDAEAPRRESGRDRHSRRAGPRCRATAAWPASTVPADQRRQLLAHRVRVFRSRRARRPGDAGARARLRTKILVEGANGPTTPAADDILRDRFILVIPDVLANAGGVTVSYFEWVQDFSSFFWTEDEINARLESIMVKAFDAIWRTAQERKVSIRTAAFIIACQRVLAAREQRSMATPTIKR